MALNSLFFRFFNTNNGYLPLCSVFLSPKNSKISLYLCQSQPFFSILFMLMTNSGFSLQPIAPLLISLSFLFVHCKQDTAVPELPKRTDWKDYGCELVTDEELIKVLAINPDRDSLNSRTLPEQVFCLRTWNKKDWRARENSNEKDGATYQNPYNRLVIQMINYNDEESARKQMGTLRRDRHDTYEEEVSGLGDESLWSTSTVTLLTQKGQHIVSISLEYADKPHDNLAHAKTLIGLALKKM